MRAPAIGELEVEHDRVAEDQHVLKFARRRALSISAKGKRSRTKSH
jgi:hypothetical protein